ncbi:polyribonucleotide nucleotidyltransferase [Emcibacteraceae bacterium]|jgi:polyribonucleotide nucleotidyltransferase|uniref:polyribonucleotide nucleotidyltransferase n=1 Tax=Pseudemcibacter sp. TaxID=2943293 RepID=UPI00230E6FC9|nr:polyribonucleotide nucleotidyltransferase [Emcibacteraceae bacterium]MDA9553219.1 polyribonucleotide nucleotidyltransferase [Emcibacteraceae bacterium]MDA9769937.1 polyribonucleotide nucleotidyltransferase [Emcibacteraceae bacterium]MDG1020182.1 polyribonucleotide nucleotidyltransferase [Emcibacteraceae bacterium]MDG1726508.1 polyribonucleotide nucleotidyltransferase [Emcibacteraceae bacterium]
MFNKNKVEITWGGRPLKIETGQIARQAGGAVMVTYGETSVFTAVTAAKKAKAGIDFFPLTVNYQEKAYAAGKIPGGFFKREARPSESEILVCRLIDRPIRPLFVSSFKNETQVSCTVMSHDLENQADIPSIIGTSAALTLSGLPFMGPVAGARVGYIDGEYVLNPTEEELENSDLDLVVAGTRDAVLMVESEANELSEEIMLGAVMFGHEQMQVVIDAIIELAEVAAKDPIELPEEEDHSALIADIAKMAEAGLRDAYGETDKQTRVGKINDVKDAVKEKFVSEDDDDAHSILVGGILKNLEKDIVRGDIIKTGKRIDGRDLDTVRKVVGEVNILPRAHGSALFTRGETQSICVSTLGTADDEQFIDALTGTYKENFMLHYNFPPYSVGEVGRAGFTSRREVGHGKLAWRAMKAVLPSKEDFPYTIRIVSEITESNGSSSMATVCGSSLSLMDAGVPIKRPVSGIAMGLIKEGDDYAVLSDILGDEDHLGDMDFKVAGTVEGITSLQMDIKITGITKDIMEAALEQAKGGRATILAAMNDAIDGVREEMSEHAPRIETIQVKKDKIREIIGTGGKVIREICEVTGAKVDIDDDGVVNVSSSDAAAIRAAMDWINGIVAEPEVGVTYEGKVVKTVDFGAFVNFLGSRDGLVHISEMANERVKQVTDVVKEGDVVKVKVLGIDDRGKVRLSMKAVMNDEAKDEGDEENADA